MFKRYIRSKFIMTYLQTVKFIVQQNTLSKLAELKCSAKHSLRNADLTLEGPQFATT